MEDTEDHSSDELEADRIMEEWKEQQDQVSRIEIFTLQFW